MMKFMKRSLSLLISAMLLLGCFALAEETPLLPIAIVSYDLTDEATTAALSALIEPKENALTRWERSAIARWHEEWGIGREMIEEALLRAGNKTTIRYVDGILRAWRAQGITTVSAARGQGQLSGSNILATQRPAPQQPAAASAQQPLSSRDWMAMFDEEG